MANLQITRYAIAAGGHLTSFGILGGQDGNREDLAIGAEAHTTDFSAYTVVRLMPEADCVIRIGSSSVAVATQGETLKAGIPEPRYVKEGERISVIAP